MKQEIYEWYVVYTRQGMEKKVTKELNKKNIESYCPVNKVERKWWALKRTVEQPLFTSYVFVKASEQQVNDIKKVEGVVNVLYWLGKPAVVRDYEINLLKSFLCNHTNVSVEKTSIKGFGYVSDNTGAYLMQPKQNNTDDKIELPTIGYAIVAGKAAASKVVTMQPASAKTADLHPQYSFAG